MFKTKHNTKLSEFIGFLRPKICLFITGIAISGYLLFNPIGYRLVFVALTAFFASATSYCYNMVTDKEEDMINKKRLNLFVSNGNGVYIVAAFFIFSLISALQLSTFSISLYLVSVMMGISYSYFRIKEMFPFKNLYTAASLSISFLVGAGSVAVNPEMFSYVYPLFIPLFVISLTSDLRDYTGDKMTGIRTIPAVLGRRLTKVILYIAMATFSVMVLAGSVSGLYVLVPFTAPIAFYIHKNQAETAHQYSMLSFMLLPLGALLL